MRPNLQDGNFKERGPVAVKKLYKSTTGSSDSLLQLVQIYTLTSVWPITKE